MDWALGLAAREWIEKHGLERFIRIVAAEPDHVFSMYCNGQQKALAVLAGMQE